MAGRGFCGRRELGCRLSFEELADGANLVGWAVYVNGVRRDCYALKLVDGQLVIDGGPGLAVIVR